MKSYNCPKCAAPCKLKIEDVTKKYGKQSVTITNVKYQKCQSSLCGYKWLTTAEQDRVDQMTMNFDD